MHDEHRGQSTSLGCGGRVYSKSWDQGSHGTSDQSDASLNWTFHVYHPTKQSVHSSRKIVYSYLDQPLALQYKGEQLPVNTTFDVLERILSVCGSGPPGATAKNYYLPMLALYSKWCSVLGGSRFKGMTHITCPQTPCSQAWTFFSARRSASQKQEILYEL